MLLVLFYLFFSPTQHLCGVNSFPRFNVLWAVTLCGLRLDRLPFCKRLKSVTNRRTRVAIHMYLCRSPAENLFMSTEITKIVLCKVNGNFLKVRLHFSLFLNVVFPLFSTTDYFMVDFACMPVFGLQSLASLQCLLIDVGVRHFSTHFSQVK